MPVSPRVSLTIRPRKQEAALSRDKLLWQLLGRSINLISRASVDSGRLWRDKSTKSVTATVTFPQQYVTALGYRTPHYGCMLIRGVDHGCI